MYVAWVDGQKVVCLQWRMQGRPNCTMADKDGKEGSKWYRCPRTLRDLKREAGAAGRTHVVTGELGALLLFD